MNLIHSGMKYNTLQYRDLYSAKFNELPERTVVIIAVFTLHV